MTTGYKNLINIKGILVYVFTIILVAGTLITYAIQWNHLCNTGQYKNHM